jgi:hypothetical protein
VERFLPLLAGASTEQMGGMTANGLHLASIVGTTMCAGILMAFAGTQKKMLQWKKTPKRCPACGRRLGPTCRCRR